MRTCYILCYVLHQKAKNIKYVFSEEDFKTQNLFAYERFE